MSLLLGSHMSIAGGYYRAAEAAGKLGMRTVQIFTKNNNQWRGKTITDVDVEQFLGSVKKYKIIHPVSHTSYLINMASPNRELWEKSVASLVDEWQRAEQLQLVGMVLHPGSATDGDEATGLARVVTGIQMAFREVQPKATRLLIENTAGQGLSLGWKLDHLATILDGLKRADSFGICFDTCHAHAAGFDLSLEDGVQNLVREMKKLDLVKHLHAIHLNDSKKSAGSRVDRHEHLGHGTMTAEGIQRFINHAAFRKLPMYLETEKGENAEGRDWDAINMEFACKLFRPSRSI